MRVLVDTSLLMLCAEKGRDYLSILEGKLGEKLEPLVPTTVRDELAKLSTKPSKKGRVALVALRMAETMSLIDAGELGGVDASLGAISKSLGLPVATVDRELARRLRTVGVEVIMVGRAGDPLWLG
ncbi:MAG: hypothetical protein QW756_08210 [Nitrososphaerota archaeon]